MHHKSTYLFVLSTLVLVAGCKSETAEDCRNTQLQCSNGFECKKSNVGTFQCQPELSNDGRAATQPRSSVADGPQETQNKRAPVQAASGVDFNITGLNTYSGIKVEVKNNSNTDRTVTIEPGTPFKNPNNSEQDLISLYPASVDVPAGSTATLKVKTACTNAAKAVPGAAAGWRTPEAPKKAVSQFLNLYSKYKALIARLLKARGSSLVQGERGQQQFLQLVTWAYYDSDKVHIVNMFAQVAYHGDRAKAARFVNLFYDDAVELTRLIQSRDYQGLGRFAKRVGKELASKAGNAIKNKTKKGLNKFKGWLNRRK